ncbi:MAG TPA: DUF1343 domain-containing protein [Atribacteraceae bacterium]|nr:DUF1343 domain-containing protein [Atribacteraceae bacterium]
MILVLTLTLVLPGDFSSSLSATPRIQLGVDIFLDHYTSLVAGQRIGLITNQSGVNGRGERTKDLFATHPAIQLTALFAPEHGIDGTAKAGEYVASFTHPLFGIPVYSLYGPTRKPTEAMLRDLDTLVFDVQDIGARWYTFISTLQYAMRAAAEEGKKVIVLDRPNPLGGVIVEGPVLEERFRSFVGVDTLPMAHGMTIGELSLFFNRSINAHLTVIPMAGYTRDMLFPDTGLTWIPTSPMIPDIESAFGYMATGLGEGTGIIQRDFFRWIGGRGIDENRFADLLNNSSLPGVVFIPDRRDDFGGVKLQIIDYRTFNPARTGLHALTFAYRLTGFPIPRGTDEPSMFEKIMGTDRIGHWWEAGLTPREIEQEYQQELSAFRELRKQFLLYP